MKCSVIGNFPAISDDLVNSYHLLLCCVDWFFANALLGGRKDLLKSDFVGKRERMCVYVFVKDMHIYVGIYGHGFKYLFLTVYI